MFGLKKDGNMGETWGHYAKLNKPITHTYTYTHHKYCMSALYEEVRVVKVIKAESIW
jgi:hypothetical protein